MNQHFLKTCTTMFVFYENITYSLVAAMFNVVCNFVLYSRLYIAKRMTLSIQTPFHYDRCVVLMAISIVCTFHCPDINKLMFMYYIQ